MMLLSALLTLTASHLLAPLLLCHLPPVTAQKPGSRWLIGDRDSHCGVICSRTQGKPVCGSDGRSYETGCELQRARCKDKTLALAHRGRCRGKNWVKIDQLPVAPAPTSMSEGRDLELKDAGQSKCRVERNQALEQARRPQESMFIPECNEDGTFAQVQCHTLTGYCWCVTSDGKPVSGSSVQNRTPVCSGNFHEFMGTHAATSGLSGSVTDRPPGPPNSGRKVSFRFFLTLNPDDGSKPTPTMETHVPPEGDEITAPTLWIKQLVKQNSSTSRKQGETERPGRGSAEPSRGHLHPRLRTRRPLQTGPVPPVHRLLLVCSSGHGTAHPWNLHPVPEAGVRQRRTIPRLGRRGSLPGPRPDRLPRGEKSGIHYKLVRCPHHRHGASHKLASPLRWWEVC
ncbi:SPARC-related modular calcium-binding protein 1 isoform X8 [Scophthalmus maximus]|uniref:SPARC-related modular calcium-binding protein 1 isoform X8 n=1 Tax=Scophthalmus maximus TaxID=52904 RepID=UPI0015E13129|nr:SPARC-related modular calcium-binding protein 1 isoform X8 [Scophthalmus maximus]